MPKTRSKYKKNEKIASLLLTMKKRNHPTPKRNVKRIDVRNVIYVIYDIYDMYGALTYAICVYVNLGVKTNVRTSGMQSTILNILHKYF